MEKNIFNYLVEIGCCYNCCLRYLNVKTVDFGDSKTYLLKNNYIAEVSSDEDVDSCNKKAKTNPCIVCLGLLQEFSVNSILTSPDLNLAKEYDIEFFTCSISMPPSILIRECNLNLHLQEKYPEHFENEKEEVPLNKAWKSFVRNKLAAYVNKKFQNSDTCDFFINIALDYDDDAEELKLLCKLQPKTFEIRKVQHRKYNGELFSRKAVLTVLSETPLASFKEHTVMPPTIPSKGLFCKSIECKRNSIYLAGRYCKYSRVLSQSPWIVDGVKTMETSVQEIIFEGIFKELGIKDDLLKFAASGREDCDVRCLGRGRPFYIEVMDPKLTKFSFETLRQLENNINTSKLIKVQDLQLVDKNELSNIKFGEENKTKDYIALCVTKTNLTEELIEKINKIDKLDIEQKTPIRVLHRRPLSIRNRTIHKISAKLITDKPNLFKLHLQTQAGTYVKEFVHGDFGRTTPNISEILDTEVDIMALDVMAINLDWPKCIDYTNSKDLNKNEKV